QGMTLLLVSHAVMDLAKHCSRAIFIHEGSIIQDGPCKDVVNRYMDILFGAASKKKVAAPLEAEDALISSESLGLGSKKFEDRPNYNKNEYRWGKGGARIVDYYIRSEGIPYPTVVNTG